MSIHSARTARRPGEQFRCSVLGTSAVTERFLRVHLRGPDLLRAMVLHPTAWARFQFGDKRAPQRAYTIINPDLQTGTFDVDLHLHPCATTLSLRAADTGEAIVTTTRASGFSGPRVRASHMHLLGDAASIPAMRTILTAHPQIPATLWLEQQDGSETAIPLDIREGDEVVRVLRGDGTRFTAAVSQSLAHRQASEGLEQDWFWLACESSANRALVVSLRQDLGIRPSSIAAMAYWKAT